MGKSFLVKRARLNQHRTPGIKTRDTEMSVVNFLYSIAKHHVCRPRYANTTATSIAVRNKFTWTNATQYDKKTEGLIAQLSAG